MSQIRLKSIRKSFDETPVLKGVSLDIEQGEFVTLVGPSGCGKSTLLRILSGLESADSGSVEIHDADVTKVRPADRNLAMVFQSYALYPHLSVADNMLTPLKMREVGAMGRLPIIGPMMARAQYHDMRQRVGHVAETLQITPLLQRKPGQLSGGQRQRVALGRAMVREPVAFLMDEPLSNLDAALRVHMRAELSELHRRLKATFVYVTHDQAEALTMSDRMALMMNGDILQVGPPDVIYADPDSLAVAKFIGSPSINVLPGEVRSNGALELFGQVILAAKADQPAPVHVGIRPEHLTISAGSPFRGRVVHRENLGSDVFLHLGVENHEKPVVLRADPVEARDYSMGAEVGFGFDADDALVFDASGERVRRVFAPREAVSA